jgi:small subunit ribosomal protein S8
MFNDVISDAITAIRNGQRASLTKVTCRYSNAVSNVLKVMKEEGYIQDYSVLSNENKKDLEVQLKYFDGQPVIKEIKRVSKPGRRIYTSIDDLKKVRNGLGISIISTSQGILSDHQARAKHIGGEILCTVF